MISATATAAANVDTTAVADAAAITTTNKISNITNNLLRILIKLLVTVLITEFPCFPQIQSRPPTLTSNRRNSSQNKQKYIILNL